MDVLSYRTEVEVEGKENTWRKVMTESENGGRGTGCEEGRLGTPRGRHAERTSVTPAAAVCCHLAI